MMNFESFARTNRPGLRWLRREASEIRGKNLVDGS
jgi:hypothetical protein